MTSGEVSKLEEAMDRGGGPRQLAALTGIRGLAAWAVVLYHLRLSLQAALPLPVMHVLGKGYLAVDLFFMLSGFVIWYNYAPRLECERLAGVCQFLWRRFARVYPLHLAMLLAFVGFALFLAASGRDASNYPVRELPYHVLLIQNWGFTDDLSWNEPAWSISTEFAAYLLFPVMVAVLARDRVRRWGWAPVIAALLAGEWLFYRHVGQTSIGADISHLGLVRCLIEFGIGATVSIAWRAGAGGLPLLPGAVCALALGAGWYFDLDETLFVPLALAAGLLALAGGRGPLTRAIGSRVFHYLGEISYSTYLAHTLILLVTVMVLGDGAHKLGWLAAGGYLAVVLAASVVLYHGLEKPAQRWLNRHPPRWPLTRNGLPAI